MDSSVCAHSVTSSVNVPEIKAPVMREVTVNTVGGRLVIALPVTVHSSATRRRPVGSAGWMVQEENSLMEGAMLTFWYLA